MSDDDEEETNALTQLIEIYSRPFAELETVGQSMLTERSIYTAVGEQLDIVGRIVGARRLGLDDDTFRRYVRATVKKNKSTGRVNELIAIADLIIFEDEARYIISRIGYAALSLRVAGVAVPFALAEILASFLRDSVADGVRLVVETSAAEPAATFTFAAFGGGPPAEGLGFRSFDTLTGGALASAIE